MTDSFDRVRAVIVRDRMIILMHRYRDGKEFWCLPGGGVEPSESHEQALVRECHEELSLSIEPQRLVISETSPNGSTGYYLAEPHEASVTIRLSPESEEAAVHAESDHNKGNLYSPEWVKLAEVGNLNLLPEEVADIIVQHNAVFAAENVTEVKTLQQKL